MRAALLLLLLALGRQAAAQTGESAACAKDAFAECAAVGRRGLVQRRRLMIVALEPFADAWILPHLQEHPQ
jgi:hypothetical protein